MGEIAKMMLSGILCQHCGSYVGEDVGYPVSCGCEGEEDDLPNWCCECDWFEPGAEKQFCGQDNKHVTRTTLACEKFR